MRSSSRAPAAPSAGRPRAGGRWHHRERWPHGRRLSRPRHRRSVDRGAPRWQPRASPWRARPLIASGRAVSAHVCSPELATDRFLRRSSPAMRSGHGPELSPAGHRAPTRPRMAGHERAPKAMRTATGSPRRAPGSVGSAADRRSVCPVTPATGASGAGSAVVRKIHCTTAIAAAIGVLRGRWRHKTLVATPARPSPWGCAASRSPSPRHPTATVGCPATAHERTVARGCRHGRGALPRPSPRRTAAGPTR